MVVIWIDASSPTSVMQSYKTAARRFPKPEQGDANDEDIILFIKDTLTNIRDTWLLVFDNYDEPKAFQSHGIRHYIPDGDNGKILFTSRHGDAVRLGRTIDVSRMSKEESVRLLLNRETANEEEAINGDKIATLLGYLALALDQASSYIRTRCLDIKDFIPHYQRRKKLILQEIPDEWEYRRSINGEGKETSLRVFTTWELSYQQISGSAEDKRSKDHFLTLAAFFDNKLISARYFKALFDSGRPEWMERYSSENEWDNYKLADELAEYQKLSLLQPAGMRTEEPSFSIHPVVRDWIKLRKHKDERQHFAWEVITALTSYLDAVDIDDLSLATKQEFISHVDACVQNVDELLAEGFSTDISISPDSAALFALLCESQGRYDDAEGLRKRALEKLGATNSATLQSIGNLANVYVGQRSIQRGRATL